MRDGVKNVPQRGGNVSLDSGMLHQGVSEENGIQEEVTGGDGSGHGSNHHGRNSGHGRNFQSPHFPAAFYYCLSVAILQSE